MHLNLRNSVEKATTMSPVLEEDGKGEALLWKHLNKSKMSQNKWQTLSSLEREVLRFPEWDLCFHH